VDPATGQYVIGYTGFENEPGSYFGMGTELEREMVSRGRRGSARELSYERMFACRVTAAGGCTRDTAPGPVSATLTNTAPAQVYASAHGGRKRTSIWGRRLRQTVPAAMANNVV